MDNANSKIYCIDPNSSLVAKGQSMLVRRSRLKYDILIFHIISIIFQVVIAGVLNFNYPSVIILYVFIMCWAFSLLDSILSASWVGKYASGRFKPFVVVDSNTITIIKLFQFNNSKKIMTYGLHKTLLKTDEDHQYYENQPVPYFTVYDYPAHEILVRITHGYFRLNYRNVRFIKETALHYYFVGDLQKDEGIIKGPVIKPNKKFKIAKIYENHENLRQVNY